MSNIGGHVHFGRWQERVVAWFTSCFSVEVCNDKRERSHRFIEESLELVQAAGLPKEDVSMLVDYVYSRSVGELGQEVGGVGTTLAAFCYAHELDLADCFNKELLRCWENIHKIQAKQATKPKGPLPQ